MRVHGWVESGDKPSSSMYSQYILWRFVTTMHEYTTNSASHDASPALGIDREPTEQERVLMEQDWRRMLNQFAPGYLDATARQTKAFQRARCITCPADLLRMVLAYALCDYSLRLTGIWATLNNVGSLSDVAILKRLQACPPWLGQLIGTLLSQRCQLTPGIAAHVRLIDATSISRPGSTGTDWRVHLDIDLATLCVEGCEVTDAQGGETLVRHPTQPGCISIADRGYAHPRGLGTTLANEGQVVVRISWQNLPLHDAAGQPIDIVSWLTAQDTSGPQEQVVWLPTPSGQFQVRLIAQRLSIRAAEAARRRIRKQARKRGHIPDPRTLAAAGFMYLITNLPADHWSAADVLALYRFRWQVEIAIKRLKSVWHLDKVRARQTCLAQTYLLAKLLAALLADAFTRQVVTLCPDWFTSDQHPVSPWRLAVLWYDTLRTAVRGHMTLERIFEKLIELGRYLRDGIRKRRPQWLVAQSLLSSLGGLS